METISAIRRFILVAACLMAAPSLTLAQAPADPWPRPIQLPSASVLVYQPQIESWVGNQIQFRAAMALKPTNTKDETFGTVFATARTAVDHDTRMVVFQDINITKSNFPTLADKGASYVAQLKPKLATTMRTISLDRVEASMKVNGVMPPSFPVKNEPPRIIVSNTPAILVPIDGAPNVQVVGDSSVSRVINTHALILQGGLGDDFYIHVYDGWMTAKTVEGPWTQARRTPWGFDDVAKKLAASGAVDMLDGGPNANPKPSLSNGVPTIYTSQVPAELIVFTGQPNLEPINGTQLPQAINTHSDVFVIPPTTTTRAAVGPLVQCQQHEQRELCRQQRAPADWRASDGCRRQSRWCCAAAGTSRDRQLGAADCHPAPVNGPSSCRVRWRATVQPDRRRVVHGEFGSADHRSESSGFFAVSAGAWFTAPTVTGPWVLATSVPDVIYTIPTSSPLHYVTYVRVYGATPQVIYVGYTPGYMGTVVDPYGTVVYGTGYAYTPWVGSVWYPPPYTYGMGAVPVYNPALGFTFGFAVGLATAAWVTPYYGAAYYDPYACCGSECKRLRELPQYRLSGTSTAYTSAGSAWRGAAAATTTEPPARRATTPPTGATTPTPVKPIAVARLPAAPGRRLVRRGRQPQLQHLHGPEVVGFQLPPPALAAARSHMRAQTPRALKGLAYRHHDGEQRSRPIEDHQLGWQRPLRRRERQRLQRQFRRWLAAALVQRLGRRRRYVLGGQGITGAAPAAIASPVSRLGSRFGGGGGGGFGGRFAGGGGFGGGRFEAAAASVGKAAHCGKRSQANPTNQEH
jgi:hypothetical protein